MSDRKALWKAIALHPRENTPKLLLADWFEEYGGTVDGPRMSSTIRWCVARKKWPGLSGDCFFWLSQGIYRGRNSLDRSLIEAMGIVVAGYWRSAEAAIRALGRGLEKLRRLCEILP